MTSFYIGPRSGMKCINTKEPSSPYFWWDNYICFNNDVPYDLEWTHVGCSGLFFKSCISWNEPLLPYENTFWDNYLCASPYPSNTSRPFTTECSSADMQTTEFVLILGLIAYFVMIE